MLTTSMNIVENESVTVECKVLPSQASIMKNKSACYLDERVRTKIFSTSVSAMEEKCSSPLQASWKAKWSIFKSIWTHNSVMVHHWYIWTQGIVMGLSIYGWYRQCIVVSLLLIVRVSLWVNGSHTQDTAHWFGLDNSQTNDLHIFR